MSIKMMDTDEWYLIEDKRCRPHFLGEGRDKTIHFEASCISTFPSVFDDCEDNYDVEDKLRVAKVLGHKNKTDTESCALVVMFNSERSALSFSIRLQDYIRSHSKVEV